MQVLQVTDQAEASLPAVPAKTRAKSHPGPPYQLIRQLHRST